MKTAETAQATLSAQEAAARLGVKLDTIYAYVSRGVLARVPSADKASRFERAAVERLRTRGRKTPERAREPLLVTTALCEVGDDSVCYRGRDALELARKLGFEQVCEWLWGGDAGEPRAFVADRAAVALAHAVQSALPEDSLPLERLRVIATVLGTSDALRYELSRGPVLATARGLIAGLVEGLPRGVHKASREAGLALRLWSKLSALPATAARVRVLELALSLCADHGVSPSTLAVRIAASQRADPYACVQTGLGALSGALHGAASLAAEQLLCEVEAGAEPSQAIGARLRRGERIPGFGHVLHTHGDPRARALLASLSAAWKGDPRFDAGRALVRVMQARGLPPPNIDFMLALLARSADMQPGASEAILALARSAGWIAHALEEYAAPTKFPWRALYVGPERNY